MKYRSNNGYSYSILRDDFIGCIRCRHRDDFNPDRHAYGQIRVFMVMSRDGLLPKIFSKIHPVHKTPMICTIITGLIAAVMAGLLPLEEIIKLCNIGTLFAFILVSIGVIVLRKTMPNAERKFRVPWVPILTALIEQRKNSHDPIWSWLFFSNVMRVGTLNWICLFA